MSISTGTHGTGEIGTSRIEEMTPSDLDSVVNLHLASMATLLTDLGRPFVRRYYEEALRDASSIILVARTASGEVTGWAMGTPAPHALNARISSPAWWFGVRMIKVGLVRPRVLLQLVRSVYESRVSHTLAPHSVELVYIGVAGSARGQGVGSQLLGAFISTAKGRGHTKALLSVEVENASAIRVYEKSGFSVESTYTEGSYHRHRMGRFLT